MARPKSPYPTKPVSLALSDPDRQEIQRRAAACGLSMSGYLRKAALNRKIVPRADHEAVRDLAKVAGDQGRLGGLLKRALGERVMPVSQHNLRALLHQIEQTQEQLVDLIGKIQ